MPDCVLFGGISNDSPKIIWELQPVTFIQQYPTAESKGCKYGTTVSKCGRDIYITIEVKNEPRILRRTSCTKPESEWQPMYIGLAWCKTLLASMSTSTLAPRAQARKRNILQV